MPGAPNAISGGRWQKNRSMQEIFSRYLNYLEGEKGVSAYTVRNYVNDLMGNAVRGTPKGFFQYLRQRKIDSLEEVDRHVLRSYITWLMDLGVARNSIARKLSAVRSFFRYLKREEILNTNPVSKIGSPKLDQKLPSFLTVEETVRLLESPDLSKPQGQRDHALLELLYASGLRVSELVNLNVEQINTGGGEIRVMGKGSKERMVLSGEPAIKALNTYLAQGRKMLLGEKKNNAVFVNRSGNRLGTRRVQKILVKYAAAVNIAKPVHPHLLRHTFATHLLDGGADLRVVQELLGHSQLSSTQVYTHVSQSQARKIYQSAHPLARLKDNETEDNR